MAPTQFGQFPAAAMIYRRHLVQTGKPLAHLALRVEDLLNLEGTALPQDAAFDELRLKDLPTEVESEASGQHNPLIHFAGCALVTFGDVAEPLQVSGVDELIDVPRQTVRSSSGELTLDYGIGLLTINAPSVQGASGNLKAAGKVLLRDVAISSPLDLVHVVLVALDGQPLRDSQRILLQVMSEEKNTDFLAVPQGDLRWIQNLGTNPWRVRCLEGEVCLQRPDADQWKVTALDLNGVPSRPLGSADRITLLPTVIYYLLEPRGSGG